MLGFICILVLFVICFLIGLAIGLNNVEYYEGIIQGKFIEYCNISEVNKYYFFISGKNKYGKTIGKKIIVSQNLYHNYSLQDKITVR